MTHLLLVALSLTGFTVKIWNKLKKLCTYKLTL